jgi:2'-hydroxyisoflavone reductase
MRSQSCIANPKPQAGKKSYQYCRRPQRSGLREGALAGKNFDVVYDNVYDWEHGTTASQVEATARVCGNNLHRYVFMSSVAAYGDGLNHHEGDALAPDDHPDRYVRNKAMSERALFRMHQRNGFPVVTLRPPFVYGPGNPFYREAFFGTA